MNYSFLLLFLLYTVWGTRVIAQGEDPINTDYHKIIEGVYPGMSAVELRRDYPGVIPEKTSFNTSDYHYLYLDTNYLGQKTHLTFHVENNILKTIRLDYPDISLSWYQNKESYANQIDKIQNFMDYCTEVSEHFKKKAGNPTYLKSVTNAKCVKYSLLLSEDLFNEKWEQKELYMSIFLRHNGEHWHDSLTADTCSPYFSLSKINNAYGSEFEFAHDLNSDGPTSYILGGIYLSGHFKEPEFPFLCGIPITELHKYIQNFTTSVDHTQGVWKSQSKVGKYKLATEFHITNDSLLSVKLNWRQSVRTDHMLNTGIHIDTLTTEYNDLLHAYELLHKETITKYGEPSRSDENEKKEIASFNKKGRSKSIHSVWEQAGFKITIVLSIEQQWKMDRVSTLTYTMTKIKN